MDYELKSQCLTAEITARSLFWAVFDRHINGPKLDPIRDLDPRPIWSTYIYLEIPRAPKTLTLVEAAAAAGVTAFSLCSCLADGRDRGGRYGGGGVATTGGEAVQQVVLRRCRGKFSAGRPFLPSSSSSCFDLWRTDPPASAWDGDFASRPLREQRQ